MSSIQAVFGKKRIRDSECEIVSGLFGCAQTVNYLGEKPLFLLKEFENNLFVGVLDPEVVREDRFRLSWPMSASSGLIHNRRIPPVVEVTCPPKSGRDKSRVLPRRMRAEQ